MNHTALYQRLRGMPLLVWQLLLVGGTLSLSASGLASPLALEGQDAELGERYIDADAYAVYSFVIPEAVPWLRRERVVIQQETENFCGEEDNCLPHGKDFSKKFGSALKDFKKANRSPKRLEALFRLDKPFGILPASEIRSIMKEGGWQAFYKKFPDSDGWIELSAVGFNADKTKAIVYVGHRCGGLCGGGTYYVLEKKNGKWSFSEVEFNSIMWAS